jgi:hypothetical protein
VLIGNIRATPLKLEKGMLIGNSELQEDPEFFPETETKPEIPPANISAENNYSQRHDLIKLLDKYRSCFEPFKKGGLAKGPAHKISIADNQQPIKQPMYRIPVHKKDEVQRQVDNMLNQGVIRPSSSPWSSPIVLAKKKNGDWRFCIDFRKINELTKKDVYPLPRIDELLDVLRGSKYFSTLDLASGYWQIPLNEKSKEITAFRTPNGHYEFEVLAFGLTNAPAAFQRMMDSTLNKLIGKGVLVYLDDVIVYGDSHEVHLERLEKVLQALQNAQLRCRPDKCHFAYRKIKYLGHEIGAAGISPDGSKLKEIKEIRSPKTQKEIKSFLGLCSYYRKFIKGFATIAEPMNKLLRKGIDFVWDEKAESAFQKLKQSLLSAQILAHFDENRQTILYTDASTTGIGAVLGQIHEGKEVLIACGSRSLMGHERNYPITELECLAMVWGLKYFRHYLIGRHFVIKTDHLPLKWLSKMTSTSRLTRWGLQLAEYSCDIEYKPGKSLTNADFVSRLYEQHGLDKKVLSMSIKAFQQDHWYQSLASDEGYIKRDGCIWSMKEIGGSMKLLKCVPIADRLDVLKLVHDDPKSGHLGFKKTYNRLSDKYYWPKMYKETKEYVETCRVCQINALETKQYGLMKPFDSENPWDQIGIDILGPFPPGVGGKRFVLIIIDYGTKWCIAEPLGQINSGAIINALNKRVLTAFGTPRTIISDQGPQFMSEEFERFLKEEGIEHKPSVAYHQQSNGQVERFNKTLTHMLKKFVGEKKGQWTKFLPEVIWAYNTSRNETTKVTPYRAVFGIDPITKVDRKTGTDLSTQLHNLDLGKKRAETRAKVKENIERAQVIQKAAYDKRHVHFEFEIGELVKYKLPETTGKGKLTERYLGPLRIVAREGPLNYIIEATKDLKGEGHPRKVHVSQLRRYYERKDCVGESNTQSKEKGLDQTMEMESEREREREQRKKRFYDQFKWTFLPTDETPEATEEIANEGVENGRNTASTEETTVPPNLWEETESDDAGSDETASGNVQFSDSPSAPPLVELSSSESQDEEPQLNRYGRVGRITNNHLPTVTENPPARNTRSRLRDLWNYSNS